MSFWTVGFTRTASTTLAVGTLDNNNATRNISGRFAIYDVILGSQATQDDQVYLWQFQRFTTSATGTAVTPQRLDLADASFATAPILTTQNITVNPTLTAGAIVLSVPLNQRMTFRWLAEPDSELVSPFTASNGFAIMTPTASALIAVTAHVFWRDYV